MPETAMQTPPETCHQCAETVTTVIDEGIAEQDRLTREFVESTQTATDFQVAAETIEFYLRRQHTSAAEHKRALMACEMRFPNVCRRFDHNTNRTQYRQNGELMTDAAVATMKENDCFQVYLDLPNNDSHNTLKLFINKCGRKEFLPSRVVLNLYLALQSIPPNCMGVGLMGVTVSSGRRHLIQRFMQIMDICDQMKDILWDEDLLLPLVHPKKRRRLSRVE